MIEARMPANGVSINVAHGGSTQAPLMFFVHGIASWWQTFDRLFPAFAQDYALAATDLRGCGRSDCGSHLRYTLDEYVADNAAVLRHLLAGQTRPCVLVGHSYGGLMAFELANQFRAQTQAVIAIDPPLFFHEHGITATEWPKFFGRVLQLLRDGRDSDGVFELLRARTPHADPDALRERAGHLSRLDARAIEVHAAGGSVGSFDLKAAVARVRCPVLLLHGDPDKRGAIDDRDLAWFRHALPGANVARVAGAGHMLHETHAGVVEQTIARFLEGANA
jgi:pimeloyl-ACP methyl ester carboxylesterase